ncbi:MAG: helix-turn-helix domain-containing protein [Synergistaceae bacterium]|nr:helix-turn-helix domain-containing protein [Synergistaceae bacterium]
MDPNDYPFTRVDNAAIIDPELSIYDTSVYMALCSFASNLNGCAYPSMQTLAERAKCSVRQARKSIRVLEERGYITIGMRTGGVSIYKLTRNKHRDMPESGECLEQPVTADEMAEAEYEFTDEFDEEYEYEFDDEAESESEGEYLEAEGAAHHAEGAAHHAEEGGTPCRGERHTVPGGGTPCRGGGTPCRRTRLTELDKYYSATQSGQIARAEPQTQKPDYESDVCLDEVPEAMRGVVDYFLLRTGRTGISPQELSAIRELEKNHTPNRVNCEVGRCIERFERLGRKPSLLTLEYVYTALRHQTSRRPPGKRRNARASPGSDGADRTEAAKFYNEVVIGYEPGSVDGEETIDRP